MLVGRLFEELARVSPDIAVMVLLQLETGLLLQEASGELQERYLAPLLAGEKFGCIGISEPDVGSNIAEIRCRATREGDEYLLQGEKQWISNGEYSDFVVCVAREDFEEGEGSGLALFLVDREQGYESARIEKLALNSQSTAQLFFSGVRIPASQRLAGPKEGLRTMLRLLGGSRPLVALMAVGLSQAALDESIEYACERRQHGKAIAEHQLIQARVAQMATELEAARADGLPCA